MTLFGQEPVEVQRQQGGRTWKEGELCQKEEKESDDRDGLNSWPMLAAALLGKEGGDNFFSFSRSDAVEDFGAVPAASNNLLAL